MEGVTFYERPTGYTVSVLRLASRVDGYVTKSTSSDTLKCAAANLARANQAITGVAGFEQLKQECQIAGSPDEVAEQLMSCRREFGTEFRWFTVYRTGMYLEQALETIRIFGERVVPRSQVPRASPARFDCATPNTTRRFCMRSTGHPWTRHTIPNPRPPG